MRRCTPHLLALGLTLSAHAGNFAVDRNERSFRIDPTTKVAYADLTVAYQTPTNGVFSETDLTSIFSTLSSDLFTASKGAVQLGTITVIPYVALGQTGAPKSDPDILILTDESDPTKCSYQRTDTDPKTKAPVVLCADAHTGGYLGLAWWQNVLTATTGSYFQTTETNGKTPINTVGASIRISWNTLNTYKSRVLLHELGHYLFGMRDEYEGPQFASTTDFEGAANIAVDPRGTTTGFALSGALNLPTSPWLFGGTAMSALATQDLTKVPLFSPADIPVAGTGKAEWSASDLDESIAVTEQIATIATRGGASATYRHGGLWSMETAIRTGVPKNDFTLPVGQVFDGSKTTVNYYKAGQGNIFLVDRSWSMTSPVQDNPYGATKWDVLVDFFGRLTKTGVAGSEVSYDPNAKFGVIAFDDQIAEPAATKYPVALSALQAYTIPYVAGAADKKLKWMEPTPPLLPQPNNNTDIVQAIKTARDRFDNDPAKPVQRNVILLSDGLPTAGETVTRYSGRDAKVRVFAVSIDTKLDGTDQFGDTIQKLASNSAGPEGLKGKAYYATGVDDQGGIKDQMSQFANSISNEISEMDVQTLAATDLYSDAAREYSFVVDKNQTVGQFALSWTGSIAPTLYLTRADGQTLTEGNSLGVTFRKGPNFKAFDIDLSKFPLSGTQTGTWKLRATAPTAVAPVRIYPTLATKSSKLMMNVSFDPNFVNATGSLPVNVVVKDGLPIEGLQVTAKLTNRATGVVRSIPMAWKGAAYAGTIAGNLQPGVNDLEVSVVHPNNGKVFYAGGENRVPDALRKQYPYFAPRTESQQVWVAGAATPKSVPGLEVWTMNTNPRNAQGTSLKLFVKNATNVNGTNLTIKDFKVRYFYSVSEFPNGVPAFNQGYLPQSKVTVGTVQGRTGLAYLEYNFTGTTLLPGDVTSNGTNAGEEGSAIEASWRSPWNSTNDWSAQGLKTTWSVNSFVNVYDAANRLIAGNPDLEPVNFKEDAQPLVAIDYSPLAAVGAPASFVVNAVDPESEGLTYSWTVDGVAATAVGNQMVYTFATPGAHTVAVTVSDNNSPAVTKSVVVNVQAASGACLDDATHKPFELKTASVSQSVTLAAGANCFVIRGGSMLREWSWSNLQFQVGIDYPGGLAGFSEMALPNGSATALTGYSQTIPVANPGRRKDVFIKLTAPAARTVKLNWWLQ